MVAFLNVPITNDSTRVTCSNLTTKESVRFIRDKGYLVITSDTLDIKACGLGESIDLAKEANIAKSDSQFSYNPKIKYFEEDSKVLCRAVMLVKATLGGFTDAIMTSSYNICESSNKHELHTSSGQASQTHAEMFCYDRLETLLDVFLSAAKTAKLDTSNLKLNGIIRIKGTGEFAKNECIPCQKVKARVVGKYSFPIKIDALA